MYKEIKFVKTIEECYYTNNSSILNKYGYIKNTELSNNHTIVFTNDNIKQMIVVLKGDFFLYTMFEPYIKNKNNRKDIIKALQYKNIHQIIKQLYELIETQETDIDTLISNKYSSYNITFFGHSMGGLMINSKLSNTKYNCYVYNPFLVTKTRSENIKNYRTNLDILSYELSKENNTIHIDVIDFLFKKKFDILELLVDAHNTDVINTYSEKDILIKILVE